MAVSARSAAQEANAARVTHGSSERGVRGRARPEPEPEPEVRIVREPLPIRLPTPVTAPAGSAASTPAAAAPPIVQAVPPAPVLPALAQCRSLRLETLRRGDAIELLAADGQWLSYRLSWVSPQQRLYVLSRFPDEARSLERAQLAGLFDSDAARLGDLRGSVEQALDQLSGEPIAA